LGRVKFVTAKAESAAHQGQPAFDWFDLESRLREFARFSSQSSSDLAAEPHVTRAHEPHDPLALLKQHREHDQLISNEQWAGHEQSDSPLQAQPDEPQMLCRDRDHDRLDMLSLLAAISSTRS
jgi:hypothetical protein